MLRRIFQLVKGETPEKGVTLKIPRVKEASLIDKGYILEYMGSDGFSERLMSKHLYIDASYNFELELSWHEKKRIQFVVKGSLPKSVSGPLAGLMAIPQFSTKLTPSHGQPITDAGHEYFWFVDGDKVVQVSFDGWNVKDSANAADELFRNLQKELEDWTEKLYNFFKNDAEAGK